MADLRAAVEALRSAAAPIAPVRSIRATPLLLRRWGALTVGSLAAAAAVAPLAIGTEPYQVRVALRTQALPADPHALGDYRRELVFHVAQAAALAPPSDLLHWQVSEARDGAPLVLTVTAPQRARGLACARDLARGYLERLQRLARERADTPSPREIALSDVAARLREQVDEALGGLPDGPRPAAPAADRARWNLRLAQWRAAFDELQTALQSAETRRAQIESTPAQRVTIDPQKRQAAQTADSALSGDLAELNVKIAELRSAMLAVWQSAAPLLEQLLAAAARLAEADADAGQPLRIDQLREHAQECQRLLADFAAAWTREFTVLRQAQPDPLGAQVVKTHDRCTQLLGDALFQTGQLVTAARARLRDLDRAEAPGGATGAEQARQHRAVAELISKFAEVQSTYDRFALTAARLEPANNIRLDAALRAARGLQHRAEALIRVIDQKLEAEARRESEQARGAELARLAEQIRALRAESMRLVNQLLALQDERSAGESLNDEWLRAADADAAARRDAGRTRSLIVTLEQRLAELARQRQTALDPRAVTLGECTVQRAAVNVPQRALRSLLAAAATLGLTVALRWCRDRLPSALGREERG